jgi:FlaA1/EpsC-like NDP-sugar epimerase
MTRFFMTIPEAAWLILDAASLGRGSDLFVLDMGEPIRILDLARDIVRLAGRDPDSHPIEITGLRPGEKLHEELFYDAEKVEFTASSKVLRTDATSPACSRWRAAPTSLPCGRPSSTTLGTRSARFIVTRAPRASTFISSSGSSTRKPWRPSSLQPPSRHPRRRPRHR